MTTIAIVGVTETLGSVEFSIDGPVPAGILWDLPDKRDRFRVEVATG